MCCDPTYQGLVWKPRGAGQLRWEGAGKVPVPLTRRGPSKDLWGGDELTTMTKLLAG